MPTRFQLLSLALSATLLSACGDRGGSTPAAPGTAAPAASSGDHPSQPATGQNSDPKTEAPAPGAGEGASAATDPSQKK